jgi:Protein of unknown function (DUF2459)
MLTNLLALVSVGLLSACSATPMVSDANVLVGSATITVIARGWHTDIGLPVDGIRGPLAVLEHDYPGVQFLVFGFGERDYLMARDDSSGKMLGALFPSKSAILMTALRARPTEAFADQHVVALRLTQAQLDMLAAMIWQELGKSAEGLPVRLADGPYDGSAYYASMETYDAFHTCNTWTALLLHGAGFPVNARGVLFANQVMQQVGQIAAVQAEQNR